LPLKRIDINLGKDDQDTDYKAKQIELHHDDEKIKDDECFLLVLTTSGIVLKAKLTFEIDENL